MTKRENKFKIFKKYNEDLWGFIYLKRKRTNLTRFLYTRNFNFNRRSSFRYLSILKEKPIKKKKFVFKSLQSKAFHLNLKLRKYFANLTQLQLKRICRKSELIENGYKKSIAQVIETRIDAILLRSNLFTSMRTIRQWINHGFILVNLNPIYSSNELLNVGDIISFSRKKKFFLMNFFFYRYFNFVTQQWYNRNTKERWTYNITDIEKDKYWHHNQWKNKWNKNKNNQYKKNKNNKKNKWNNQWNKNKWNKNKNNQYHKNLYNKNNQYHKNNQWNKNNKKNKWNNQWNKNNKKKKWNQNKNKNNQYYKNNNNKNNQYHKNNQWNKNKKWNKNDHTWNKNKNNKNKNNQYHKNKNQYKNKQFKQNNKNKNNQYYKNNQWNKNKNNQYHKNNWYNKNKQYYHKNNRYNKNKQYHNKNNQYYNQYNKLKKQNIWTQLKNKWDKNKKWKKNKTQYNNNIKIWKRKMKKIQKIKQKLKKIKLFYSKKKTKKMEWNEIKLRLKKKQKINNIKINNNNIKIITLTLKLQKIKNIFQKWEKLKVDNIKLKIEKIKYYELIDQILWTFININIMYDHPIVIENLLNIKKSFIFIKNIENKIINNLKKINEIQLKWKKIFKRGIYYIHTLLKLKNNKQRWEKINQEIEKSLKKLKIMMSIKKIKIKNKKKIEKIKSKLKKIKLKNTKKIKLLSPIKFKYMYKTWDQFSQVKKYWLSKSSWSKKLRHEYPLYYPPYLEINYKLFLFFLWRYPKWKEIPFLTKFNSNYIFGFGRNKL